MEYTEISENASDKVYKNLVQKIQWDDGREEFRFCYYYKDLGESEDPNTGWIYGQFAFMTTRDELLSIFKKMKEKKWI